MQIEAQLHASQAREQYQSHAVQLAQAPAGAQRATLQRVFEQAPLALAILEGPTHLVTLANAEMGLIWGRDPAAIMGQPHFEALPDLAGQGFEELFAAVYQTGQPYYLREQPVRVDRAGNGQPTLGYYHLTYQPLRGGQGHITAIMVSALDVTEQVLARQQMQRTHEELETRVAQRTAETQAALREAEQQREQLQQQQRLLSQILGQVPAAIAALNGPEHRYSFFNANYLALTGSRAHLTQRVADQLPEVQEQGFVTLLDQVYASGQPYTGTEMPVQLLDAATGQLTQRYLDFVYQPILNGQGQVQGILTFIVDATEKVRARQQAADLQAEVLAAAQRRAQERENLYQVFEQTPAVIGLLRGPEHRIEYINPAFQTLFAGRPLLGLPLAEAQPEAVGQGFVDLLNRVYQTGETYFGTELPLTIQQADGQPDQTQFFNFTYQPYRENGAIVGISVFTYDVTAQVLARREADQQRELLHTLFMDAPAPIAILDGPSHVYQLVNPAYQQIFPGRALAGRPVFEALPELADTAVPGLLGHVYSTGEPFVAQELPLQLARHDGDELQELFFNFTYQPRYNAHDQIDGILVFAYEVTEQVRARQGVESSRRQAQALADELATTNQRLRRTNADLDTFVYTASHDLKSPIANLEGLFTALRQQLPAEALQAPLVTRLLGMMDGAVLRFRETLGHLTDVSKLQQADGSPAEAIDLEALVRAVRLDLAIDLAAAGASLTVDVGTCPTVHFSAKNLRSIVYNLLSNALKYHAPDRLPLIALRCRRAEGQLVLEVQDNGLGLDATQQSKLFGMFRRLHTHVEGSGVGLYMVKRMVENAGGTITVQSQPGVGSTFRVALPG